MAARATFRSSELWRGSLFAGKSSPRRDIQKVHMPMRQQGRKTMVVRAETESRGMTFEDGGRWLSSTTRHVRIYAAYIDPKTGNMDQEQTDKLSLILDPDDEFVWTPEKEQKVFDEFAALVDHYTGADLTEYTLRLIGSDLEHFIRKMLLANEIKYNLNCKVLNFSMGKPRYPIEDDEE